MKIAFNPSTVAALTTPPNNKDITFDLRGRNIFARGVKFCGTDTWRDIKINNVSIGSNILDLRNGSNTTLTNTNGVVTINSTWRPVVDNLTSDSTTSSLSAKQGKILKSLIDGKSNSGHTHDDRYVKKTGDTMSGVLTIDTANFGALTIKRNDDTYGASIQFRGKSSVYGYIGLNNDTKDKQFLRWGSDTSKTYTILDTSSTYTSNGKGVINGTTITQVDNATSAGNADTVDGVHVKWGGAITETNWLAAWENYNTIRCIAPANVSVGNADKLDGYHANKYLMVPTTIDATSLNSDTYYPVTIQLPCKNTRIEVEVSLDSGTKPSWSTHQNGFTSRKVWESNGSGWGTTSVERNIFVSTYSFASEDPIRGIGQLTNSSVEFVYVRGGGKYYFRVSVGGGTPTLRKENYTTNSQSVAPTKTAPDLIVPCINTPHRRVTLWGQSFNGTNSVNGSLSNTGTITASAAATYDIGSNALDYRNGYFQWIGAKSNTNLRLAANNSDNQIVLHTNGNVGIGTASPTYKLHVIGDIYTTTGFKKNGSSNSYVLLGGGGHKLISDFATSNHTHSNYVTALGTNGNYLTWTKNGSTNNITVPYATTSSYLTNGFSATYTNKWDCNAPDRVVYSDYGSSGRSITNAPSGWNYGTLLELGHTNYNGLNGQLNIQLMWDVAHNTTLPGTLWFRGKDAINGWAKSWAKVITDQNISSILSNYYTKSETDSKYVTLTTTQTIGGSKTFTTGIKFNTNKNGDANLGSNDGFKLFYNETSGRNFPGNYYNVASFITGYTGFQLACYGGADQALKYRHREDNGTWHPWKTLAFTTDIPNSLKNPHALTISLNGTSQGPYDGSAAKNVNITPSSIGAATSDHNHDNRYLKLTGGTMTGIINRRSGGMTISGRDHAIIRQTYAPGGSSWNPIACVDTETGTWTLGHLSQGSSNTDFSFCFSTNADYNAGNNEGNYVTLRNKVGTIALLSDIPNKNSWNYDDRYVKKSGDTMTGNLFLSNLSGGNSPKLYFHREPNTSWAINVEVGNMMFKELASNKVAFSIYENSQGAQAYIYGQKIIHSGNIGSQSVNYANSAGNADTIDGYHASSFYKNKSLRSDKDSIYDLRYNYGDYDKGDYNGTYKDEYPTNYGTYLALAYASKNTGALMFFDAPTSNILGHIYVRTRGAGDPNTTYSEWGKLAYITDNVASATKLQAPRNIWGNLFDGTNDIGGTILPSATHKYNLGSATYMFEKTYTRYIDTDSGYDLRLCCSGSEVLRLASADKSVNINYDANISGKTNIASDLKVYNSANHGCSIVISEFVGGNLNGGSINVIDTNGNAPNRRPLILQYGQGNVGIGITTPAYKLHVDGDIYTTTGFKKNGSSDSYVLLGGGGHSKITDLSVANADTVDGYHASSFSLTSHTHDYIPRHGMMNSAYACIPTYNGETGWHRIATIQEGSNGYGSYILYLCGFWSYAPNTNAIIHIDTMHTTAQLTQVSGIVGYIDSIRLVNISANAYYVDVHINYTGANIPGTVYCYFLGNGTITPRTSAEKITESVTSSAELDLVNGGRAHSATKVIVNQNTTNDANYPLVWSNQANSSTVTENQLYKSWSNLYYNPKNKRLTVGGSIYAAHFYESSDKTLKKNIKSILSSTNIPKIREFDWKDTGEHSYGFIAQELEEQGYGCLVSKANGKKTVNYTATLALTVAKLQNLINIQNKKISNLTKELKALKYGRKKNS